MPCGGIYPLGQHFAGAMLGPEDTCFSCRKKGSKDRPLTHFCDEWDCYLHEGCIDDFLLTKEGEIVTLHEHEVIR